MQSDWHRYNLKRRVASLPPLSSDIFTEKVLANQATAAATAAKAQFEKVCPACSKTYFSDNAFRNHLGSQKHKQRVAQMQNGDGTESRADDETNSVMSSSFSLGEPLDTKSTVTDDSIAEQEFSEVVDGLKRAKLKDNDVVPRRPSRPHHSAFQDKPPHTLSPSDDEVGQDGEVDSVVPSDDLVVLQKCLFCTARSESLPTNIIHMQHRHGLFIPEQDYLIDLEGLVKWLHDRVAVLHECLYCGIVRHTTSGIQTHMRDKGHCMIAFESEEQMIEVGQFYDFRSTYSESESDSASDDEMSNTLKMKQPRLGTQRKAEVLEANGDDEEWESDDSSDTEDGGTLLNGGDVPKKRPRASKPVNALSVYHDEDGLHLPSGRTAGHRSLARYFRQNLHNYPTPEERVARRAIADAAADEDPADGENVESGTDGTLTPTGPRGRPSNAVMSRANGGLGMVGVSAAKKREVGKKEEKDRRRAAREEMRYKWGVEKRGNQQKHFRDPLLQ